MSPETTEAIEATETTETESKPAASTALYAGSDDGVYRIDGVGDPDGTTAERVLDAERVYRVRRLAGVDGPFVTAESGLYHSPDGEAWTALTVPSGSPYSVTADPAGERLYVGTRPSDVFVADLADGLPTDPGDWSLLSGFRAVREAADWGIPRHDGVSQVRSLRTHPDAPDRLVAGVEVGGIHVSDDRGETWTARRIEGFDAPHTDDVHHVAMPAADALVVATGSGLFRSTDVGRSWERLDADVSPRYFRESTVRDGVVYAGAAPASSATWAEDDGHGLFAGRDADSFDRLDSPVPDESVIGWCTLGDRLVGATYGGTLLERRADGWAEVGSVPTPGRVRGRYLQLVAAGDD